MDRIVLDAAPATAAAVDFESEAPRWRERRAHPERYSGETHRERGVEIIKRESQSFPANDDGEAFGGGCRCAHVGTAARGGLTSMEGAYLPGWLLFPNRWCRICVCTSCMCKRICVQGPKNLVRVRREPQTKNALR